jgi:antitoxin YefM
MGITIDRGEAVTSPNERYSPRRAQTVPTGFRRYRPVRCGTIVAMSTEALRTVKDRLSEFVDRVQREHDRVVITRNGRPAAVLISPDDLDSLEETLDLLSDRKAIKELRDAELAVAAGDVVRGVDAVRNLRGG